ncbi:transcriptional regulator [Bradyrhizobium brasilense]|uniref:mobile mystery protein A n=1 Tax=Bradyrhizobium brasilense TaxID=1419277 RepID=UPI000975B8E1|nr:mobile mystery protein A [Bradyrhizobium brasilense]OMI06312.1 transcriptional regulator [Bradyrhizobium brasilense]
MKPNIRSRARKVLDDRLVSTDLQSLEAKYKPPPKGWIRAIRDALGMSSEQLARRLSLASQSVDDSEKAEANGSIQLNTLRRAAEALDCTLVYAFIPKTSLEETVQSRARRIAMRELRRVAHTMKLEDQATDDKDQKEQITEYIRDHVKERDLWKEP